MRILLVTHLFPPSIGGVETMSWLLADEWTRRGHLVTVVTQTPAAADPLDCGDESPLSAGRQVAPPASIPADESADGKAVTSHRSPRCPPHQRPAPPAFTILRQPSPLRLLRVVAECDLCFHNNICLAFLWPLLLVPRPWIVTHQTWLARPDGTLGWREHLKRRLLVFAHSIAISRAVAARLPGPSTLIPNAYDDGTFHEDASGTPPSGTGVPPIIPPPRLRDLIFVGRLVSDKGADLLLNALAHLALAQPALHPSLTLVGDGPERPRLAALATHLGLDAQVRFAGPLLGPALAAEFTRHRLHVVPSRWAEPFGIVALEAAACGCVVIGSHAGGLADAIGPCGCTFPNGDAPALAALIAKALRNELPPPDANARDAHLRRHRRAAVADAYLALFHALSPATAVRPCTPA